MGLIYKSYIMKRVHFILALVVFAMLLIPAFV